MGQGSRTQNLCKSVTICGDNLCFKTRKSCPENKRVGGIRDPAKEARRVPVCHLRADRRGGLPGRRLRFRLVGAIDVRPTIPLRAQMDQAPTNLVRGIGTTAGTVGPCRAMEAVARPACGWRDVLGVARRLIFEVGCHDAGFLCRVAAKHRDVGFVGIDWKAGSLTAGAKTVTAVGLNNVALMRGRAQDLRRVFADAELDEIWIFHPEPCDKPKERANRLVAEPFLLDCSAVLKPGGRLVLKTDHPGYYQWTLGLLGEREPAWFADVREGRATPGGRPKVRARDLFRSEEIPPRSDAVLARFAVAGNSADFWNDAPTQAAVGGREFAGEMTAYESQFVRKKQPIYFVELERR